jgi:hypothetical protein
MPILKSSVFYLDHKSKKAGVVTVDISSGEFKVSHRGLKYDPTKYYYFQGTKEEATRSALNAVSPG